MGIFSSKKSKRKEIITLARKSMHDDFRLITYTIVKSLNQHWKVLEDKFEQYIEEDDYGNSYIDNRFNTEIIYFSHKVILPELTKLIDNKKIKEYSFVLMPNPPRISENLYDIRYADSDSVITEKYVSGLLKDKGNGLANDELLYSLNGNVGKGVISVSIEDSSNDPLNKINLLTLTLDGSLRTNSPMKVTSLAGKVFSLFFAMYSTKPADIKSKDFSLQNDFTGNDPYKYEEFIKELLRDEGFSAKRTRGSGDYGVDVIASKGGKIYAIQCKLYNHPVGTKAVQEIVSGRIFYRTDFAIVVSDNSFTDAARSLARRSDVALTHHKNLLHKLASLIAIDKDESHNIEEMNESVDDGTVQEPIIKKSWTTDDADELIAVVLPTINNDK